MSEAIDELVRALAEQEWAEERMAKAAHALAEAEEAAEDDPGAAAEVERRRKQYATAEAAVGSPAPAPGDRGAARAGRGDEGVQPGRAAAVAEVTTLLPGEVTIGGRAFTLGAVYAPAPHVRPYEQGRLLPLRLVDYDPAYPWPDGRVEAELVPTGVARAAHATPPAVRPGVGGLGGRGEGGVSRRTSRAWWLAGLRRGLHLLAHRAAGGPRQAGRRLEGPGARETTAQRPAGSHQKPPAAPDGAFYVLPRGPRLPPWLASTTTSDHAPRSIGVPQVLVHDRPGSSVQVTAASFRRLLQLSNGTYRKLGQGTLTLTSSAATSPGFRDAPASSTSTK